MRPFRDKTEISVDLQKCQQCRHCEAVCPSETFHWEGDAIVVDHPARCIRCGHCAAVCPNAALSHSSLPPEKFSPLDGPAAIGPDVLRRFLATRRSCRRFEEQPLSKEEIELVIDAARYAPTPTNAQKVRFIVLSDRESIRKLTHWIATYFLKLEKRLKNPFIRLLLYLTVGSRFVKAYRFHFPAIAELFQKTLDGKDRLFYDAPCVVVLAATGLPHMAAASTNLTAMQLLMAAQASGLGAFFSGYTLTALLRDKRIRARLGISKGLTPGAVIALGRPAIRFHRIPPRNNRRIIWTDL